MPVKGKEALRSWVQPYFSQFEMKETHTVEKVKVSGDIAFYRNGYTLHNTPKSGGEAVKEEGKGMTVFKRHTDGSWKVTLVVWNSNTPPPTP